VVVEGEVVVKKGRPWFSIGVLVGEAVVIFAVAAVYFEMRFGQRELSTKVEDQSNALKSNEAAVVENSKAMDKLTGVVESLSTNVAVLANDKWTATDEKFYGLETARFWSEFQRLNPTSIVPPWPEPHPVSGHDGGR